MIRILVVDDVAICREPIAEALRHQGYEVACADSGSAALAHLRDAGADLVLLDVSMPDLDGLGVLRVMRRNPAMKDIPVIMLTGRADRHLVAETAKCGISGYVLKSDFSLTKLVARVRACVGDDSDRLATAPAGAAGSMAGRSRETAAPTQSAPQTGCSSKIPAASGRSAGRKGSGTEEDELDSHKSLRDLKPVVSADELSVLVGEGLKLRPLGSTVQNVMAVTANTNCCVEDIAKAVNSDQVLAIRIMKLANSSAYSRGRPVTTVKDAVARIGTQEVRSIVMALDVIQKYEVVSSEMVDPQLFWEHSIACGLVAAAINKRLEISATDDFFLWGMIHDVGRFILLDRLPKQYAEVCAAANTLSAPLELVESKLLRLDHCDVLEKALVYWQFPRDFIVPVINHHRPVQQLRHLSSAHTRAAATIALANALAHALLLGSSGNEVIYPLDELADLVDLHGSVVGDIIKGVISETNDLKISMLSQSDVHGWPDFTSTVRERLTSELRPLCLGVNRELDAYRLFFERIASGDPNGAPNLAVLYAQTDAQLPRLTAMLDDKIGAMGVDELPMIVVLGRGKLTGGISAINGRRHVVIKAPATITALLDAVEELAR